MSERYRKEYDGEFVIVENKISGGKKHQEREWIENPIKNQHISGRAAVIGHGQSRYNTKFNGKLNLQTKIEQHAGWHLGRKRLQTYGSEGCWREMQCDFYVEFEKEKLAEIKEATYQERVSVYTHARNCIDDPGEYYLVPYGQRGASIEIAAWLACFDGHKEVFLLGVDATDLDQSINEKRIKGLDAIIKMYKNVQFIHVTDNASPPDVWQDNPNFVTWKYAQFISYCDI